MEWLSVVTHSLALAMLLGAIVLSRMYPDFSAMSSFARSMICWFIVLGPIQWLNSRLIDVVRSHNSESGNQVRAWTILIISIIVSLIGLYFLIRALSFLP
jgi:hypothetical protein